MPFAEMSSALLTWNALVTLVGMLAIVWAILIIGVLIHPRTKLGLIRLTQGNSDPIKLSKCQSKNVLKAHSLKNCKAQHPVVQEGHEVQAFGKLSKSQKKKSKKAVLQKKQKPQTDMYFPSILPSIVEEPANGHVGQDISCTMAPKLIAESVTIDDHEALDGNIAAEEGACSFGVLENAPQSASTHAADLDVLHHLEKNVVAALEHDVMEALESAALQALEQDLQSCNSLQHGSLELQVNHMDDTAELQVNRASDTSAKLSPNLAVSAPDQEHEMSKQEDALHVYELDEAGMPVLSFTCSQLTDMRNSFSDDLLSESHESSCRPGTPQMSCAPDVVYFHHEDMPVDFGQHMKQDGSSEHPAPESDVIAESKEVVLHAPGLHLTDFLNRNSPHSLDIANSLDPDHLPASDPKEYVDPGPPPGLHRIEYPPPGLALIDAMDAKPSELTDSCDPDPPPGLDLTDLIDPPPGLHISLPACEPAAEGFGEDPAELQSLLQSINLELNRVASNFGKDFSAMQSSGEEVSNSAALWESLSTPSRGVEQYANDPVLFGDDSMYRALAPHASSAAHVADADDKYAQKVADSSVMLDHLSLM